MRVIIWASFHATIMSALISCKDPFDQLKEIRDAPWVPTHRDDSMSMRLRSAGTQPHDREFHLMVGSVFEAEIELSESDASDYVFALDEDSSRVFSLTGKSLRSEDLKEGTYYLTIIARNARKCRLDFNALSFPEPEPGRTRPKFLRCELENGVIDRLNASYDLIKRYRVEVLSSNHTD